MRYLVVSDIHANWAALDSVLRDAADEYDRIINCGDLVGYGPDPNAVVDWCRSVPQVVIRGNHDKAAVGLIDLGWFNPVARQAALWTAAELTTTNRGYLLALQKGPLSLPEFEVFHGAPADEDEYLQDEHVAATTAADLTRSLCFFGHTHIQGGFVLHRTSSVVISPERPLYANGTAACLINPGSVGQPRDLDPRAAYAIYDSADGNITYYRAEYDIDSTAQKIGKAGLPDVLGRRLYIGT